MRSITTNRDGFSLLELIITIGILLVISFATSTLLRSSLDIRLGLAQDARVTHRLSAAITKIAHDLEHAYIVPKKGPKFNDKRTVFGRFSIKRGDSDQIQFTTFTHQSILRNSRESDATFVLYEVRDAPEYPGRKHLFRGETKRVPQDFRDEVPMKVMAKFIKKLKVSFWNGETWKNDNWDDTRSDGKDKLPHMVRIEIEGWVDDPVAEGETQNLSEGTEKIGTVVNLVYGLHYPELKKQAKTVKWNRFGADRF